MTTPKPSSAYREFEPDDSFSRSARAPGGLSRVAALARAAAEVDRVKPRIRQHIAQEFMRLEAALRAARGSTQVVASIDEAHEACRQIRDVAEPVGYPLVGLIATNLCTIFEAVETVQIAYPAAVIDCHFSAMRLALSRRYQSKKPIELPELSAGLLQIAQIAKSMTAGAMTTSSMTTSSMTTSAIVPGALLTGPIQPTADAALAAV